MLLEIVFWATPNLIYSKLASWTDDYRLVSWVSCCWSQVRVLFLYMVLPLSVYIQSVRINGLVESFLSCWPWGSVGSRPSLQGKEKDSHLGSFKHFKSGHEPCSIVRVGIRRQIWYFRNSELPDQSTYFLEIQTLN